MAPESRTKSGKFKKGQSGNPGGRTPLTPEEKSVKLLTRQKFAELVQLIMTKSREDLEALISQSLPYEEELFIRHMLDLGQVTNWNQYDKYLDRRIGKVKEEMDVNVVRHTIKKLSGEERVFESKINEDNNGEDT